MEQFVLRGTLNDTFRSKQQRDETREWLNNKQINKIYNCFIFANVLTAFNAYKAQ